ncbi:hypothetical protein ACSVIJ_02515 [Pseudomonas sp. NCHU5208]|uniref:hypothetical protein n=1 Tax=unclassified Pseudomonas TaxID=196821 RepID=UPI003F96D7D8
MERSRMEGGPFLLAMVASAVPGEQVWLVVVRLPVASLALILSFGGFMPETWVMVSLVGDSLAGLSRTESPLA